MSVIKNVKLHTSDLFEFINSDDLGEWLDVGEVEDMNLKVRGEFVIVEMVVK